MRTSTTPCDGRIDFGDRTIEPTLGRYLVAIYGVLLERGAPATTGEVARRLDVTPASATEMFRKLEADGLVFYRKGEGVRLTPRGSQVARVLTRRQCLGRCGDPALRGDRLRDHIADPSGGIRTSANVCGARFAVSLSAPVDCRGSIHQVNRSGLIAVRRCSASRTPRFYP
ncbi:metal-dependent transcriptional regulator (plasmid) [Haloferacaceae archaeon DSL9]